MKSEKFREKLLELEEFGMLTLGNFDKVLTKLEQYGVDVDLD